MNIPHTCRGHMGCQQTPDTTELAQIFTLQQLTPFPPEEPLLLPWNRLRNDFINFVGEKINLVGFPRPLAVIADFG